MSEEASSPEWVHQLQLSAKSTRWQAGAVRWQAAREAAAVAYLSSKISNERFLPPIGGWSVDYTVVAVVLDHVLHKGKPVTIVELGTGASTPWFAAIAQQSGGNLISIEHDATFAARADRLVDYYGLGTSCTVTVAELTDSQDATTWYDTAFVYAAIGDQSVDVLLVDGPPNRAGRQSRRPALFALQHLLAADSLIVLDDVVRDEEKETLTDWEGAFGARMQALPVLERAAVLLFEGGSGASAPPRYSLSGTLVERADFPGEE